MTLLQQHLDTRYPPNRSLFVQVTPSSQQAGQDPSGQTSSVRSAKCRESQKEARERRTWREETGDRFGAARAEVELDAGCRMQELEYD
eukprot:755451-Hanusia_phi.AAC.2